MRILHLINPQAAGGGPCTMRLVADAARRLSNDEHHVLIVGGAQKAALAANCGLRVGGWIRTPRIIPWGEGRALRRIIDDARARNAAFDLIHAWDQQSAAMLAETGNATPRIATIHACASFDWRSDIALNRIRRDEFSILVSLVAVRRQLKSVGVPHDRTALMPPAVDLNHEVLERDAVRMRWAELSGDVIDAETFVVGLMGEPANSVDARLAVTIAARVALSGLRIKLIVHEDAAGRLQAEQSAEELNLPDMIVVDESAGQPWRIVTGLDAVLNIGPWQGRRTPPSSLPLLWALSAGVPTIAERSDWTREIIDHEVNGWLIGVGDVNAASDFLIKVTDDQTASRHVREAACQLASEICNIDEYCNRLRHAYELLLANRSVRVVQAHELQELEHAASVTA